MRWSLADYTFSGTQVHIPKGQKIWIPMYPIHHDPTFYPDPLVFDPERFLNNNGDLGNSVPYLAFGDGSRNCIGKHCEYLVADRDRDREEEGERERKTLDAYP